MRISDWSSDVCSSDLISGFVAPTLTPALCALLIKPAHSAPPRLLSLMQQRFDGLTAWYTRGAGFFMRHGGRAIIVIVIMLAVTAGLWRSIPRSEEHTSELQSLMRISSAVFCL